MLLHVLLLIHAFRDARAPLTVDMTPSVIHGLSRCDWKKPGKPKLISKLRVMP